MKLVLAVLAVAVHVHVVDAQIVGIDCCPFDENMYTLEEYRATICYQFGCPAAGYHPRDSCDCHTHSGDPSTGACCYQYCEDVVGLECPAGQSVQSGDKCYDTGGVSGSHLMNSSFARFDRSTPPPSSSCGSGSES